MRTIFRVKWPVKVINKGPAGICLEINWKKMVEWYPFLKGANYRLTEKSVKAKKK